jgi:hypothetical protein
MAAATITNTSFGFNAKTGTDAKSVVTANRVNLRGIEVWGTAADTALVYDTAGVLLAKFTIAVTAKSEYIPYWGASVNGITVTLSANTIEANFIVS